MTQRFLEVSRRDLKYPLPSRVSRANSGESERNCSAFNEGKSRLRGSQPFYKPHSCPGIAWFSHVPKVHELVRRCDRCNQARAVKSQYPEVWVGVSNLRGGGASATNLNEKAKERLYAQGQVHTDFSNCGFGSDGDRTSSKGRPHI